MTNNWSDIGNSTLVVVMGANPVENHPACAAHINRARFPKDFFSAPDPRASKPEAGLIVIDPRKTRTALQIDESKDSLGNRVRPWDRFIRIRPGTDIAFINGVAKYIIDQMHSGTSAVPAGVKSSFFAYLNQGATGSVTPSHQTFYTNKVDGNSVAATPATAVKYGSKYTDARFLVAPSGNDYDRADVGVTGDALVGGETQNQIIYNFPKKASAVDEFPNTVYNRLRAHLAPYTLATVADICGCTEGDIKFVGDAYIAHSRCSSGAAPDADGNWPQGASGEDPRNSTYRATTMLYAMGLTQHTCGAQNVKSFAVLQTLMGNMGRAGGGINALRGIHNVQGSTDMGMLFGNIPAYSGNPTTQIDVIGGGATSNNAFGKYMDALWGIPLSGSGNSATDYRRFMDGSYDDAYKPGAGALQQRGFYNMTMKWFGDMSAQGDRTKVDACYSLWPKGNGHNHIKMFRQMAAGNTTVAVVWGQNPAVTEPNQSAVREGLKRVKLLVVTDMFETETAACDRKEADEYGLGDPAGVTILLPSCAHVEKAGSSANSGRVLQWRYQATLPKGDSKDDTELLLRLAKALDGQGAFSHIRSVWDTYGIVAPGITPYKHLYEDQYGGFNGVSGFNGIAGTGDFVAPLGTTVDAAATYSNSAPLTGSEWAAECAYRQMCDRTTDGTIWIYVEGYDNTVGAGIGTKSRLAASYSAWTVANRAKSRDVEDPYGTFGFHKWGYSWLVNRRVLYNNSEVPGDQADFFMTAESQSRLFVASAPPALLDYARWYRTYHRLADTPRKADNTVPTIHVLPGKFPSHTEPYESPRADLVATYGKNAVVQPATGAPAIGTEVGNTYMNLLMSGTPHASDNVTAYPLVLTTIRCVEHFQGGPITRNNWWNVEAEPEPWVEINSADAFYSDGTPIPDGAMVKVVTARTSGFTGSKIDSEYPRAEYGYGFRARVGAGLPVNQRVGRGVVAIPWHWGDRGLSTGSRANDLTIDAGDANTYIPEYKACLCRLEKM